MKQMRAVCCAQLHFMNLKNDLRGLIVDESHVFLLLVSTPPGNYFVLFWGTCIAGGNPVHAI